MEETILKLSMTAESARAFGAVLQIFHKFSKEFNQFYFMIHAPKSEPAVLFHLFTANSDYTGLSFVLDGPTMEYEQLNDNIDDSTLLQLSTEHCKHFLPILQQEQTYPLKLILCKKRFMSLKSNSKKQDKNCQFQYCTLSAYFPIISCLMQPSTQQYYTLLNYLIPPVFIKQSTTDLIKHYIDMQNNATVFSFAFNNSNQLQFLLDMNIQFQICSRKFNNSDYQSIRQQILSKSTSQNSSNSNIQEKPLQAPYSRVYVESKQNGEFYLEQVKSILLGNKQNNQQSSCYRQLLDIFQTFRFSQLSIDLQHYENLIKNFFTQVVNLEAFQTMLILNQQHMDQLLHQIKGIQLNCCVVHNSVFGIQRKIGNKCYGQLRIGQLNNQIFFEASPDEIQQALNKTQNTTYAKEDIQESYNQKQSPMKSQNYQIDQQYVESYQNFDNQQEGNNLFRQQFEVFSPLRLNSKQQVFEIDKQNSKNTPTRKRDFVMDRIPNQMNMSLQLANSNINKDYKSLQLEDLSLMQSNYLLDLKQSQKQLNTQVLQSSETSPVNQFVLSQKQAQQSAQLQSSENNDDKDILSVLNSEADDLNIEIQ